ncbi:MAG: hypothetical protein ACTSUK_05690 [Promethearchaeota archaeon]
MSKDELFREYERLLKQLRETGKKIEMLKAKKDEEKYCSSVLRRLQHRGKIESIRTCLNKN